MASLTFITCAVTGNHTTRAQNPNLPVTPNEIAEAALSAAEAGAAIAHIHVRDPQTAAPSMKLEHYEDVVAQIRRANPALIINLTTGPGGRYQPSPDDPRVPGPKTTLTTAEKRVAHISAIRPDIATLDLNTMVFGGEVVINAPDSVRKMAAAMRAANVLPELELFDSGDIQFANDLIKEGTLAPRPLCSIVMGIKYGFKPVPETLLYARGLMPEGAIWTGFGTGRMAFPMVAQSFLAGGCVRVGLEDAVYLSAGQLAPSNAEMVVKAKRIVEDLGGVIASSHEVRALLKLPPTNAAR
ncbi:MAG: 3-keto-5-aminohexanoate cleavage protein [Proteobacteria bacterium]|nr:3-keto-5-aminohexanoate cleavage protein [Pseudomonadota bacterium]